VNLFVNLLQKSLAAPYFAKSRKFAPPDLRPAVWDCVPEAVSDHFTVGAAMEDLTPPDLLTHKYYMAGYGIWKPIQGVLNPVYATAVWIDDNAGHGGILLVSVDCVGMLNNDVALIRERLAPFCERTGCRAVNIMATHCHASIDTMGFWGPLPKTGRDKRFFALLFDKIEQAANAAYDDRKDGGLYFGSVETDGIQQDKRLPHVFSKTLTRLRFVPADGSREIYIINYAAHPEVLGSRNVLLSADFVHYVRETVQRESGALAVYFNGAVGGMITPTLADGTESIVSMRAAGEKIAAAALSVAEETKLEPKISTIRKEFFIDVDNTVFALCGVLGVMPREKFPLGSGQLSVSMKTELNYLEIGSVHILMIPGELFPELAYGGYLEADVAATGGPELNPTPLLEMAGDPGLLIFGLANDELGYFIPPNDYILDEKYPFFVKTIDHGGRRHYEEINSTGPRTAHLIAAAFEEILEKIRADEGVS